MCCLPTPSPWTALIYTLAPRLPLPDRLGRAPSSSFCSPPTLLQRFPCFLPPPRLPRRCLLNGLLHRHLCPQRPRTPRFAPHTVRAAPLAAIPLGASSPFASCIPLRLHIYHTSTVHPHPPRRTSHQHLASSTTPSPSASFSSSSFPVVLRCCSWTFSLCAFPPSLAGSTTVAKSAPAPSPTSCAPASTPGVVCVDALLPPPPSCPSAPRVHGQQVAQPQRQASSPPLIVPPHGGE